jgi:TRAP-type C4-dicarboxylate transport system permease small subunit
MVGESDQNTGRMERLVHRASWSLQVVSRALMFFMALFVAVDVVGRYVFNKPFKGSTDLVELMMGVAIFFGLAYCASQDGHTRVDVVYTHLPVRAQAYLDVFTFAASLFIYALITWQLSARVWYSIVEPERGTVTDLLRIPHMPVICLAALGSAVLCLELLVRIIRSAARTR